MTEHEQGQKFVIDKIKAELKRVEKSSKESNLLFDLVTIIKSLEVVKKKRLNID